MNKVTSNSHFRLTRLSETTLNRLFIAIFILVILGTLGILGYTIAAPKISTKFTEFYILGAEGKAADYPIEYVINNQQVPQFVNNDGTAVVNGDSGEITLIIINHEQQTTDYTVKMTIDDASADFKFNGTITDQLGPIELKQGNKWESKISIIPHPTIGDQKVELLLFKGNETVLNNSLRLWIHIKQAE
jgi:uncharacterized membrane protein